MTCGGQSAQTALAEIQVLLNDKLIDNMLVETHVSPPKFSRVAQKGRKSNAAKAAGQYLQCQSEQAFCIDNTNRSLQYEFCMREGTQGPIVGVTFNEDKENCVSTTPTFITRAK